MYQPESTEPYTPVESKTLRVLTAAFFLVLTPIFGFMAIEDLAELVPAPVVTVQGAIGYIDSQTTSGTKRRWWHTQNIIYMRGDTIGMALPKSVFTAPDREDLRKASTASISYYDEKRTCAGDGSSESVWDAGRKIEIYNIYNPNSEARPSFSATCRPIVAISLDGKEYLSIGDFRLQVLIAALGKLAIALAVPGAIWLVRNIQPAPPTPRILTGIDKQWEDSIEKFNKDFEDNR